MTDEERGVNLVALYTRVHNRLSRLSRANRHLMLANETLRQERDDLAARVAELECPKRRAEQYFTTEGQ